MSTVIAGYQILAKLGQGGMGTVYRARQLAVDRAVALKVLVPRVAGDQILAEGFLREARAMGAINHPNVLTIHDAGRDGKTLYIALELMSGGDAEKLRREVGGKLPLRRALEIVRDAAAGAVALHAGGLLHRDIKPANIFLTAEGTAKLADLGLARLSGGPDELTADGAIVGTPAFMAPEQAAGSTEIDARADIYALGATLYTLAVGRRPFQGATAHTVLAQVLNDPVPEPQGLPSAVRAVIMRAMARDCGQRFPSAREFHAAVVECLRALDRPQTTAIYRKRRRAPWWPVPLAAMAVAGVILVVVTRQHPRAAEATAVASAHAAPVPVPSASTPSAAPAASEPAAVKPPATPPPVAGPWEEVALANAGFDGADKPDGWLVAGDKVSIFRDGAARTLRIIFHTNAPTVRAEQQLAIDPRWMELRASCRVRAPMGVTGTDPSAFIGCELRLEDPSGALPAIVWRTPDCTAEIPPDAFRATPIGPGQQVPPGYKRLSLAVVLDDVKGIVDVDDVRLEARR